MNDEIIVFVYVELCCILAYIGIGLMLTMTTLAYKYEVPDIVLLFLWPIVIILVLIVEFIRWCRKCLVRR